MKQECASCAALRRELAQLRGASEQRAQQDHDQCVAMFQQMQALVQLNQSLMRGCSSLGACEINAIASDREELVDKAEDGAARRNVQRLQAIVVQQAKEIEKLRRRQREVTADGRARPQTMVYLGNQQEAADGASAMEDSDDDDAAQSGCRPAASRHASQLRRLPLTSLHAQLKGKDLQLQRLQQVIDKLEMRVGQLVDRKRSMTQRFQLTAKTQQAHLKKYLAYIRLQTTEKKALEQDVRELNKYVDVLEKKLVSSSLP